MKDANYHKKRRKELIKKGLCTRCKQPRGEDGTGTQCKSCANSTSKDNLKRYIEKGLAEKKQKVSTRITKVLPEDILTLCRAKLAAEHKRYTDFGWTILGNVSKYLSGVPQHLSWTETFWKMYPQGLNNEN